MEWFGLVELFSILSSLLVRVHILLSRPRGRVPQLIADYIPWAVVHQRLSGSVQISFVLDFIKHFQILLGRDHVVTISVPVNLTGVSFGVDETGSESGLIGLVVCVVIGVSKRASLRSISSRGRIQSVVLCGNVHSVEPSGSHGLGSLVQVFGSHDISALLC